ncbi:hypothetical protein [Maricaulis salignorans]|uniref:Uncharacterized protein n=1 Tax=Maricaulis salignorans TaxID=144026 RepID=A0A1G9R5V3_9PROT|nr:hypothetical protein [Maricaulis salignorans]SDM18624.1 hypothetical protein SAMN04488568_10682 [Maricaulis salignorans]
MTDRSDTPQTGPWPFPNDHFAGWVPCATGHLSFGLFGRDSQFSTANVSGNGATPTRHVFIAQRRESHDLIIPAWLLRHVFRYHRVAADYFLIANTERALHPIHTVEGIKSFDDELGCLTGTIAIIIDQNANAYLNGKQSRALHNKRNRFYKSICREAEAAHQEYIHHRDPFGPKSIFTTFKTQIDGLADEGLSLVQFKFAVYRTGEIRIEPIESSFPLDGYEGDEDAGRSDYIRSMAEQAYYFAKDAGHRHYHHYHKQDNLIPITPASRSDDESWRRETMWSLVRAILSARRKHNIEHFSKASGISAYAASFQTHLGGHKRSEKSFTTFVKINVTTEYDLSFLNASLDSRREELSWARSNELQVFFASVGVLISVVGLWLAGAQWKAAADPYFYSWPISFDTAITFFVLYPEYIVITFIALWMLYLSRTISEIPWFSNTISTVMEFIDSFYYSITTYAYNLLNDFGERMVSILRIMMFVGVFIYSLQKSFSLNGMNIFHYISDLLPF